MASLPREEGYRTCVYVPSIHGHVHSAGPLYIVDHRHSTQSTIDSIKLCLFIQYYYRTWCLHSGHLCRTEQN